MRFKARKPTEEEFASAMKHAKEFAKLFNSGKSLSEIRQKYRYPIIAIERAINAWNSRNHGTAAHMTDPVAIPIAKPVAFPVEKVVDFSVAKSTVPSAVESHGATDVLIDPMSYAYPSLENLPPPMGLVGAKSVPGEPTMQTPLAGTYAVPTALETLYHIMVEFGLRDIYARGIIRRFSHYRADDYETLKQILNETGTGEHARTSILAAWKEENGSTAVLSRKALSAAERNEKIRRLKKELGVDTEPLTAEESAERIARRKAEVELKLLEKTLEEKERGLNPPEEAPPAPPAEQVEMTDIVISANGIPQRLRIPQKDLPLYAPFMIKPDENGQTLTPEMQAMKEELAELRRMRQEDEEKRKIDAIVGPLEEQIRRLEARIQQETEYAAAPETVLQRRLDALEKQNRELLDTLRQNEISAVRDELMETRKEMARYRGEFDKLSSPEFVASERHRFDSQARQMGYIPTAEVPGPGIEDIKNADRLQTIYMKDRAINAGLDAVADKARHTGRLKDEILKSGVVRAGLDALKDAITKTEDRAAEIRAPTVEELTRMQQELDAGGR